MMVGFQETHENETKVFTSLIRTKCYDFNNREGEKKVENSTRAHRILLGFELR